MYVTEAIPDGSDGNTSGMRDQSLAPDEVLGLNWGAFLLPLFWCLGNRSWGSAILCLILGISLFMRFVLLFGGNITAWSNKRWVSIESFKATQRNWALAGILFYLVVFGGTMLLGQFNT